MHLSGGCHCGNLGYTLATATAPARIPARACGCSFCVKHGGVWTALPDSTLTISVRDTAQLKRYAFETRTALFHVCRDCGVVPFVISTIDGRDYAVVNINTIDDLPAALVDRSPVSFDGEGEGARLERRARHWIADVRYAARDD